MFKITKNGWTWLLRDQSALEPWFDYYEDAMEKNCIKSNAVRAVFTAENYFIKYDAPQTFFKRLRSLVVPKVKLEFDCGVKLEKLDVPVVNHVGWARCGARGLLLTEHYPNAQTARDYWYEECVYSDFGEKERFIIELSQLIKKLIESGVYHPDFHLGNILIDSTHKKLALVDVYGVQVYKKLTPKQILDMIRIVVLLRDGLQDSECIDFIHSIVDQDAAQIWNTFLAEERQRVDKLWKKRAGQIRDIHEKYCTLCDCDNHSVILKHDQSRKPIVSQETLLNMVHGNIVVEREFAEHQALSIWMLSFKLQFHCISHVRPIAWERDGDHSLYFEKLELEDVKEPYIVDEFIHRCFIAGINNVTEDNVKSDGRLLYIADISKLL